MDSNDSCSSNRIRVKPIGARMVSDHVRGKSEPGLQSPEELGNNSFRFQDGVYWRGRGVDRCKRKCCK